MPLPRRRSMEWSSDAQPGRATGKDLPALPFRVEDLPA